MPQLLRFLCVVCLAALAGNSLRGASDYLELRAAGDAKLAAGDREAALSIFEKAREADPKQLGIHDRIAQLALELGRKELGLEAVEAMLTLDPRLKDDTELAALQRNLEAIGATASGVAKPGPSVDSQTALDTRTAELALRDAVAAYSLNDGALVQWHVWKARELVLPLLAGRGANYLPAWELAARSALLLNDHRLAAVAFVNIERLEPGFATKPALLELMAELNSRPLKSLRDEARPKPAEFLKTLMSEPRVRPPYVNSLGMKFVPVPGTDVLFSVWEMRVQDYAAYADAVAGVNDGWANPGFPQDGTHPVVNVSWEDAQRFAAWLTEKERHEGRLNAQESYQLPTDAEWSLAVGLGSESGSTPRERDGKQPGVYPWGTQWPPPRRAGNYDSSLSTDSFDHTSPVGSFAANQFGLFDLGGNVWEWCEDGYDAEQKYRVLRGGSWRDNYPGLLLSSDRGSLTPGLRSLILGFRGGVCVGALR